MSVHSPDLTNYLAVASAVTSLDVRTPITATKLDLTDSVLHASSAGFDEQDLYPSSIRRQHYSCGSRGTIRYLTATSVPRG